MVTDALRAWIRRWVRRGSLALTGAPVACPPGSCAVALGGVDPCLLGPLAPLVAYGREGLRRLRTGDAAAK